jgi:hypothetical protein
MIRAEDVVAYLLQVGSVTFTQLFTLLGPGLILVLLLSILSSYVQKLALITFGTGCYLRLFSLVGTTIHEIGHWVAAFLFGHEIRDVQLFKPDKEGHLGHVIIRPDRNSLFKEIGLLFFGIAPIIFGTLVIFLSMLLLGSVSQFARRSNVLISA